MNYRTMIGLGAVVVAGCSSTATSDPFGDEKVATNTSAIDVDTDSLELDGLMNATPDQAAAQLVASTSTTVGCRTRTIDPSNPDVVHVVLDACTGRFGRHVVDGQLTVTFSANPDGSLHAQTVSHDLTIDGLPFTRTVSADIAFGGTTRTATRHAVETGTTSDGDTVSHTGDHVVVTDEATHCHTVNGTGTSVIGGTRTLDTTIVDFVTCETTAGDEFCPSGSITHVNQSKDRTVEATFDGSTNAIIDISKPKGNVSVTWNLECTPKQP